MKKLLLLLCPTLLFAAWRLYQKERMYHDA